MFPGGIRDIRVNACSRRYFLSSIASLCLTASRTAGRVERLMSSGKNLFGLSIGWSLGSLVVAGSPCDDEDRASSEPLFDYALMTMRTDKRRPDPNAKDAHQD
jgi:hypothetical protein